MPKSTRTLPPNQNCIKYGAVKQEDFETMTCSSRNKRLYTRLMNMGLYVIPASYDSTNMKEYEKISYLLVSAGDYDDYDPS